MKNIKEDLSSSWIRRQHSRGVGSPQIDAQHSYHQNPSKTIFGFRTAEGGHHSIAETRADLP